MKYRPEIDGLRSIAVVPVILFHAGLSGMDGGFLGVDIFFVISGYLITTIIVTEISKGTFSFRGFYERRVRRIFPALFFVLLVCMPFAAFLLLPYQLEEFSWSAISTVAFVSNIFFWKQGGYFAEASELKPLLHTWSLAVEEQYYIGFPVLALLLAYFRPSFRVIGITVIILISLALSEWGWRYQTAASFFLLPTRAWELLIGSLTAYITFHYIPHASRGVSQVGSLVGLIAVLGSITFIDDTVPVPSLWTLIPVGGTAMILYYGHSDTIVGRILANRLFVGIGLLSYSMYLWHQPVLAFARIYEPDISLAARLVLAAAVIPLSYLSWKYIESPFRNRTRVPVRAVYLRTASLAGVLVAISAGFLWTNGLLQRVPEHHRGWASTSPLSQGQYVMSGFMGATKVPSEGDDRPILLVGDSFAQDMYNVLAETGEIDMSRIGTAHIQSTCQFFYGNEDISEFRPGRNAVLCEQRGVTPEVVRRIRQAEVVIVAMRWQDWAAQRIGNTLDALNVSDETRIFVVSTKALPTAPSKLLDYEEAELVNVLYPLDNEIAAANASLRRATGAPYQFIGLTELYCIEGGPMDETQCRVFNDEGELISYDGEHLTQAGTSFFGELLTDFVLELRESIK